MARPPRQGVPLRPRPKKGWKGLLFMSTEIRSAFPKGGVSKEEGQGFLKGLKCSIKNKPMTFYLEGLFQGLKRSQGAAGPRPSCLASHTVVCPCSP